ncbi:glycosyltransferase family 2 protein [Mesonia sp. K7]|uniref:glycosyltransferase family 2 protein n=1 Tax=Mesonia sp. K7 TaxID=2218606 RepID=UPI000DA91D6A|nr:glycosyltransferase family 2 protein [Mesonia sp. K7]PZD77240.1 glycosyltransferase family 2 protein [Mesonia sp. K7]
MSIAIVILNWNGKDLLEKFLPSVTQFSPEATIYVADNASTDNSVAFVKENYPDVKIIINKVNGGYAKGYNDALKQVKEDIYILLNSDIEVTKGWLLPIKTLFESHPHVVAAQPKILDYKRKNYFEYAGAAGGFIDKMGYPFCRGRIFDTIEEDQGQYDTEIPIFWASGACLAVRREVFEKLNGFDEDYFAHQEEIDLCWRIHNLGYQIFYTPKSKVYHVGGATLNTLNPKKTFYNFRNSLYNLLKNAPESRKYFLIFTRFCLDGLAGIQFLAQGKPKHCWAIINAHVSFYQNFTKIRRKAKTSGCNTTTYAKVNAIVWHYFVENKKRFNEL